MSVYYLRFSSKEEMLYALNIYGIDDTGHSPQCILPGNTGRIWVQDGDACIDIDGWHANIYAEQLPNDLVQYVVAAPKTPFLVM